MSKPDVSFLPSRKKKTSGLTRDKIARRIGFVIYDLDTFETPLGFGNIRIMTREPLRDYE